MVRVHLGPPPNLSGYGGLAQLVEHLLCKQGVTGSSPVTSTRALKPLPFSRFKAQRSGFESERRHSEMSELSPEAEAKEMERVSTMGQ